MKDSLGDRMKEYYENITRYKLVRRTPAIIRLDMRSGHKFTKHMKKIHDDIFKKSMWATTCALCSQIQNAQIGYTQSDEISILLIDYHKLTTSQWFDGVIQKIASVSASIATIEFNKAYMHQILLNNLAPGEHELYSSKINTVNFDSRVFNLPISEVCNYMIWRQQDATRNSIESIGMYYFSQKELYKVNCNKILDKLITEKNVNWNDYPSSVKRGVCAIKHHYTDEKSGAKRQIWVIDDDIPVFSKNRWYIEKYLGKEDTK